MQYRQLLRVPVRISISLSVFVFVVAIMIFLSTRPALAVTFTVTTELDGVDSDLTDNLCVSNVAAGGPCTLRAAVQQANFTPGPDSIILPDGDYGLTIENLNDVEEDKALTGDLDISSNVVINGTSATGTIIRSEINDRVFHMNEDAVARMSRLTVRDGVADRTQAIDGGAVRNNGGNLELVETIFTNNKARRFGGAIESFGTLTIFRSTFSDNQSTGLNISRGGAVSTAQNSIFRVYNSTFSGNRTTSRGGALDIRNNNNEAILNNVTIVNNVVEENGGEGGGLYVGSGGAVIEFANTIIAGNKDGADTPNDCDGQPTSLGYNLIQNLTKCTVKGTTTGNITGQDPLVGPLQDNGGPTPTHALLQGSPAINAGNPAALGSSDSACRTTDQRNVSRSGRCDIGAYELIFNLYLPTVLK